MKKIDIRFAVALAACVGVVGCSSSGEEGASAAQTHVEGHIDEAELELAVNDEWPDESLSQEAFLAANARRSAVEVTESGLHFEVLEDSQAEQPEANSVVTVHYVGSLLDGTTFDSSRARGQPATFQLSNTIAGWVEGVQKMRVGGLYRLVIPAHLAYGNQGVGSLIAPGDALMFMIELLEINAL